MSDIYCEEVHAFVRKNPRATLHFASLRSSHVSRNACRIVGWYSNSSAPLIVDRVVSDDNEISAFGKGMVERSDGK